MEELLAGNEDKYKGGLSGFESNASLSSATPKTKAAKPNTPYVAAVPNSSHLDAVPQPTPINRNRVIHKKVIKGIITTA